jgi:DNA-directed RNA polymerase subunit alpha
VQATFPDTWRPDGYDGRLGERLLNHPNGQVKWVRHTHSKYYIFDDATILTGSINLEDRHRDYFDYMVQVDSPALTARLRGRLNGTIALDAAFSPVRVVNYEVENMRVGDRTDYNRIRFHIETDGSISPREAFRQAALILVQQFDALSGAFAEKEKQRIPTEAELPEEAAVEEEVSYEDAVSKKKLEELELGARTANALYGAGIKNVGQILKKSEKKLREVPGLGEKGVTEIKKALGNLGFTLKQ